MIKTSSNYTDNCKCKATFKSGFQEEKVK